MKVYAKYPVLYEDFKKGNFVVQRSDACYLMMTKDQSHEHSNDEFKNNNGSIMPKTHDSTDTDSGNTPKSQAHQEV